MVSVRKPPTCRAGLKLKDRFGDLSRTRTQHVMKYDQKTSFIVDRSISEICRKYAISPSTFQIWKEQFLTGARSGLEGKSKKSPYENEISHLKSTIADLAIANDTLKKIQQGRKR